MKMAKLFILMTFSSVTLAQAQESVQINNMILVCMMDNPMTEVSKLADELCLKKTGYANSRGDGPPVIRKIRSSWGNGECGMYVHYHVQAKFHCLNYNKK